MNRSRGEYDYVAASAAFALGLRADPPPTGIGPGRSCWTTTCLDLHGVLVSLWYRFPYQCVQGLSLGLSNVNLGPNSCTIVG